MEELQYTATFVREFVRNFAVLQGWIPLHSAQARLLALIMMFAPNIALAVIMGVFFSTTFWWSLFGFAVFRPHHTWNTLTIPIVSGGNFAGQDGQKWIRSSLHFLIFVATLLVNRLLSLLFRTTSWVIRLLWNHLIVACALLSALWVLSSLMSGLSSRTSHMYSQIGLFMLFLDIWISNTTFQVYEKLFSILELVGKIGPDVRSLFVYPPLEPQREIRLLRLARRTPYGDLRAELISCTIDTEERPKYDAISYTWGHSGQEKKIILLNGQWYLVNPNVYNILRRHSSFFRPRLIWIDSISIDQENDFEKSHQVRRMKDIYRNASSVLVCLGESPDA